MKELKKEFLAFQYPTEIPGVNTSNFLRTSLNKVRRAQGKKRIRCFIIFENCEGEIKRIGYG